MRPSLRNFGSFLMLVALASCVRPSAPPPASVPAVPAVAAIPPATALAAGVSAAAAIEPWMIAAPAAARALDAFRISCPVLLRRDDASGLTAPGAWAPACAAAGEWSGDPAAFFARHFELVEVGDGGAFATGYFEPEIRGSRTRRPGYDVPVYAKPDDLLDANPATGERGRGRMNEAGEYVLYHDRAAIEQGALAGRGLEIAWAADPVDLFFLQIQGSGRLRLPDGSVMRIGYAGQNGREYLAIGRVMRDRGLIEPPVTMQKIVDWLRAHPEEGKAIMRENKSYVFFRELTGPGPIGAMNVPVTPRASVAADPAFVPLGAPVLLSRMEVPAADGLWIAQDTGGAIKGANRFDTFWGAGADAASIAGGMQAKGRALLLLPRGTAARIHGRGAPAQR